MTTIRPQVSAAMLGILLVALALPPAILAVESVTAGGSADGTSLAAMGAPPPPQGDASQAATACNDDAYSTIAQGWTKTLKWWFNSSSTPNDLSTNGTLNVLRQSFANMTGARNDCGLPDNVGATSSYQGATTTTPGITKRGFCKARDGLNVIGFGRLPYGVLAVTCVRSGSGNHINEIDIRINSNMDWELTPANCFYEELLEPTMTHEIGHAFGLGHVSERKHGRLTMSTTSDGPCSNAESTLGSGDVRGMHHLYPQP